jgi:O-succinylhomoserine sulfhydrylase
MGGAVLGSQKFHDDHLNQFLRHTGPSLSPFNAWTLVKGLETLEMRMAQHCANAREVAEFLESQSGIRRVLYPGLDSHPQAALARRQMRDAGSVVSFEIEGDKARAFRFLNALRLIDISNNLGDAKSLITHPATTTHQRLKPEERAELGIGDDLMRLSVGLEDPEDLKEDLSQAFSA